MILIGELKHASQTQWLGLGLARWLHESVRCGGFCGVLFYQLRDFPVDVLVFGGGVRTAIIFRAKETSAVFERCAFIAHH